MSRDEPQEQYGTASLEPAGCAIAGAYGTWQLSYTVGASGIAAGGAIRIYTESDTDWAVPQLADPSQAEFMTVDAPPGALLDVSLRRSSRYAFACAAAACGKERRSQ